MKFILDKYKRFPGDVIVVPMVLGVILNTFFPQSLTIGGFWTSTIQGTGALVGMFMLCIGATINVKSTGTAMKIGAVVISTKVIMSIVLGLGVAFYLNDNLFGLSSLAIIGAISVANNALYSGIMSTYGTDAENGAVCITTLSVGPTVTMIVLSSAGLAAIPIWTIIGSILPLVLGMFLGATMPWVKQQLSNGVTATTITVGFALGCGMSLSQLIEGGLSGILLGLLTSVVVGSVTILADKFTGGTGLAGAAISSTAASAIAIPAALALADPKFEAISGIATAQIATSVILTAFLVPTITGLLAKKQEAK